MTKMQAVVDLARFPLNDDDKTRTPDTQLLMFAIHGVLAAYKRRPDLFIGQFDSPPSLSMTLNSTFPLPDEYVQTIADYVTSRVEARDDEHVNNGRAAAFMQLFGGGM